MSEAQPQEEMAEAHDHELNIQQAQQLYEDTPREYLREIVGTNVSALTDEQTKYISNDLSPDYILAHWSREQLWEQKWKLRIRQKDFIDMHPPQGSALTGEVRAVAFLDPTDMLPALNQPMRMQIRQAYEAGWSRITRGKEGWQQDKLNESVAVSQRGRENESKSKSNGIISRVFG